MIDNSKSSSLESQDLASGLSLMSQIGQAIVATLEPRELIWEIYRQTHKVIPADIFSLSLLTDDPDMIELFAVDKGETVQERMRIGELTRWVVEHRMRFITPDDRIQPPPVPVTRIRTGTAGEPRAYILIPMITHDKIIGVISVQSYEPDAFNDMHLAMLSAIASHSAVVIENNRLLAQTERRAAELTSLERIGYELARLTNIDDVLKEIIAEAKSLLGADSLAIFAYDERRGKFRLPAFILKPGGTAPVARARPPREKGLTIQIVLRRCAILTEVATDGQAHFEEIPIGQSIDLARRRALKFADPDTSDLLHEQGIHSSIGFPLSAGRDIVGVLYVNYLQPHAFDQDEIQSIGRLAQYAGTAIQRANVYGEIQALHQAGHALASQTEMRVVLTKLVEYGHKVLGADLITIYPYRAATDEFELPPVVSGESREPDKTIPTRIDSNDTVRRVVKESRAHYSHDAQGDELLVGPDLIQGELRFVIREGIASAAALPLRANGEVLGALFFNYRTRQRFGSHQRMLIETFATYAATAIQRARLLERLIKELRALAEIDEAITAGSLQDVLDKIIQSACEIVGAKDGNILLLHENGQYLYLAARQGEAWRSGSPERFKIGETGVTGWVAKHKKPARIDDVHTDEKWKDVYIEVIPGTQSELSVPILDEQKQLVGIILLDSKAAQAFSADDERLLVALAEQAYIAIHNSRLYEQEQRARKVVDILREVDKAIAFLAVTRPDHPALNLADELSPVLQIILKRGLEAVRAPAGNIMVYDEATDDLYMAVECGVLPEYRTARQKMGEGVVGRAALEKRTLRVDNVTVPPWDTVYLGYVSDVCSELAVPLVYEGRLVGVLNAESPLVSAFGPEDEDLFEALAGQAVIAYFNAEQYQALQTLREVNQLLASGYDSSEVLKLILQYACVFFRVEWGNLRLYDDAGHPTHDYVLVTSALKPDPEIRVIDLRLATLERWLVKGIVDWVAQQRQLFRSQDDVRTDSRFLRSPGLKIRSEMAAPLLVAGQLVGVLNLESERLGAFDGKDEKRMVDFSAQAALAVHNAHNLAELQETRGRFSALYEVGAEIITAPLDEQKILEIALNAGLNRTGVFYAIAWQPDPEGKQLEARLVQGEQPAEPYDPIPFGGTFANSVAWREWRTRSEILVDDVTAPPEGVKYRPGHTRAGSMLVVPMVARGDYFGNLDFRHKEPHGFKPEEIRLLSGLAAQAANAIRRVRRETELNQFRQREHDARAMAAIGMAAGELGHRIGNKLGLFKTHIEEIKEQIGTGYPDATRRLDNMLTNTLYLLNLTQKLKMELSDQAEEEHEERPVYPVEFILSEARKLKTPPDNIHVSVDLEAAGLMVRSDDSIFDAFINIYNNAIEALEPKGGTVCMSARQINGGIEFRITDDGPGIEAGKLDKIFDLFYSTKPDSLGFGLFSAKQRVLANDGQIEVQSKVGEGTTFIIRLPSVMNKEMRP